MAACSVMSAMQILQRRSPKKRTRRTRYVLAWLRLAAKELDLPAEGQMLQRKPGRLFNVDEKCLIKITCKRLCYIAPYFYPFAKGLLLLRIYVDSKSSRKKPAGGRDPFDDVPIVSPGPGFPGRPMICSGCGRLECLALLNWSPDSLCTNLRPQRTPCVVRGTLKVHAFGYPVPHQAKALVSVGILNQTRQPGLMSATRSRGVIPSWS